VGMVGTSFRCTSGMGWKGPARSNDVSNPTPTTCLHQGRNEIALLFVEDTESPQGYTCEVVF